MFIKLGENLSKTLPLKRVYKGIVVDNVDPLKLKRVKVSILGFIEGSASELPWCFPKNETFLGGSNNSGKVAVPEVGSELEVRFPFEDIYSPFYDGYWCSSKTSISDFDADYPNSYGFKDSTGTKLVINKAQKTLKFDHTSGITFEMSQDGKLTIDIPQDFTFTTATKTLIESAIEFHAKAPIIKLGDSPSFHATIAESLIAGHDTHKHLIMVGPALLLSEEPLIKLSDKAGTALDVTALKIFIQGNI